MKSGNTAREKLAREVKAAELGVSVEELIRLETYPHALAVGGGEPTRFRVVKEKTEQKAAPAESAQPAPEAKRARVAKVTKAKPAKKAKA